MAYLKDTEGEELKILSFDNSKTWNAYISPDYAGGGSYDGISIAISIPEYLTDGENEYDSFGLLVANLGDIFEEYLDDVDPQDGGESLPEFIKLLELYKNKAEAKKLEIDNKR